MVEVVVDIGHRLVVVELCYLVGVGALHVGIEVSFLEHHSVAVAVQHLVAVGLPCAVEFVGEVHLCRPSLSSAELNLYDAVRATNAPLCRGGRVLEHRDALDVFRVDVQERRELFLVVHVFEVHRLCVVGELEYVVVDHYEWLGIAVDGGGAAQTHCGAGAEVTRVRHDVETGDLSLQRLVDRFECETFEVVHLHGGDGSCVFSGRYVEACGGSLLFAGDNHFGHLLGGLAHVDLVDVFGDGHHRGGVAPSGPHQLVLLALHAHCEVTVGIRYCAANDTVVGVHFLDLHTRYTAKLVRHSSAYAAYLCAYRQCHEGKCQKHNTLYIFVHRSIGLVDCKLFQVFPAACRACPGAVVSAAIERRVVEHAVYLVQHCEA